MSKLISFVKREPVLIAAAAAALFSCCFVPPDAAYWGYLDLRTLALLYCLMAVVAGLGQAGFFDGLAHSLCQKVTSVRAMGAVLVLLCFFSAMLITNDVALLTFVPFAVAVLTMAGRKRDLIYIVVLQTAAANLGSMLTPVGNPQNLYLYSRYQFAFPDFLIVTLPCWIASLALLLAGCLVLPGERLQVSLGPGKTMDKKSFRVYAGLFAVCLLTVLRVLPWPVTLLTVAAVLFFYDRKVLMKPDLMLLLTFVAFFIFSGNLARIPAVDRALRELLRGREFLTAAAASQVISNVPAALLLSGFTQESRQLVLGVNIGGLGTPIASLASLISLKLYSRTENARTGKYLWVFLAGNLLLLIPLSLLAMLFL